MGGSFVYFNQTQRADPIDAHCQTSATRQKLILTLHRR